MLVFAIILVSVFVYTAGLGRTYRWARPKWGTMRISPETAFTSIFWPVSLLVFVVAFALRVPLVFAFNLGYKKRVKHTKLPEARIVTK